MCIRVKSCCCWSLETGTKIIASLHVVFGAISLIQVVAGGDIGGIVNKLIYIGLGILLFVGAAKQNATLVKLYLVLTCMYLVFAFVLAGVFIGTVDGEDIVPQYHSLSPSDKRGVDEVVSTTIVTAGIAFAVTVALTLYFWMVVYSFYQELKEGGGSMA